MRERGQPPVRGSLNLNIQSLSQGGLSRRRRSNSLDRVRRSALGLNSPAKSGKKRSKQSSLPRLRTIVMGLGVFLFALSLIYVFVSSGVGVVGPRFDSKLDANELSDPPVAASMPTRSYDGHRLTLEELSTGSSSGSCSISKKPMCTSDHWVVVATHSDDTRSYTSLAMKGYCVVVVPQRPGIVGSISGWKNIEVISIQDQKRMAVDCPLVSMLPEGHISRKNIGYLFAIHSGAKEILDLSDDVFPIGSVLRSGGSAKFVVTASKKKRGSTTYKSNPAIPPPVINPLPMFQPFATWERDTQGMPHQGDRMVLRNGRFLHETFVWPRGFPISMVRDRSTYDLRVDELECSQRVSATDRWAICTDASSDIVVRQMMVNLNPDLDAVFGMTSRHQKINFTSSHAGPVAFPLNSLVPYNSHSSLHLAKAFWGLLLPTSLPDASSDIWRAYTAQPLFHTMRYRVGYSDAAFYKKSESKDLITRFRSESHLYSNTPSLTEVLWKFSRSLVHYEDLRLAIQDVWIHLYERNLMEEEDVLLVQAWIKALLSLGYEFPDIKFPS